MANQANTPRKAAAELLAHELTNLQITAGILLKAYRSYKRPSKPDGYTQDDVSTHTGVSQSDISKIENGKYLPPTQQLRAIMNRSGFDTRQGGGAALLELLCFIRDKRADLKALIKDKPR